MQKDYLSACPCAFIIFLALVAYSGVSSGSRSSSSYIAAIRLIASDLPLGPYWYDESIDH